MTDSDQGPVAGLLAVGQLVRQVMALGEILQAQEGALLRPAGLTHAQRSVLVALRRHGPLTMSALGRGQGFSRQNARVLVQNLVQADYLRLKANPDHKRAQLAEITTAGLAALQRVLHGEGDILAGLAKRISREQARQAEATLAKITATLVPKDQS